MEDKSFETLIKSKKITYNDRWKPLKITDIEEEIASGCLANIPKGVRKNIAYNLQYLEYMTFQLDELELNNAIKNSIYKNYIVIGSSIIEAIFDWIIKDNGLSKKCDVKLKFSTKSNEINHDGEKVIVETKVYKKVTPFEIEIPYDAMIKKIESKNLLNISPKAYPYIKNFRQLRNRVHLQQSNHDLDTDWWSFSVTDYLLMKYILYIILNDTKIKGSSVNPSCLYFLKLKLSEFKSLCLFLKTQK